MSEAAPRAKILVVEDEADIRGLLQEWLEIEGYVVDVACEGQDALNRLRACADADLPDVILLDLMMPVKDGFAFRAEQVADPRLARIPVIVVSADAHMEEKKTRLGVRTALRKPIDFDRFLVVLDSELRQPGG